MLVLVGECHQRRDTESWQTKLAALHALEVCCICAVSGTKLIKSDFIYASWDFN